MLPILLSVLVALLFILLFFAMERRAKARLKTRHPPPGKLVDIGGYRLHINAVGPEGGNSSSTPTVVMEAGRGDCCLTWSSVQTEVAQFVHVASYDRAGLGWSERRFGGTNPQTAASSVVDELDALLRLAGESPPFVLVGHSIGGLYVRLCAQRFHEDIVGMVLVDPTHEDMTIGTEKKIMIWMARFLEVLNVIGIPALLADGCGLGWIFPAPSSTQKTYAGLVYKDNKYLEACVEEIKNTNNVLDEAKKAGMGKLGDIPLVVISAAPISVPRGICSCLAGMVERANTQIAELHTELASLSPQGRRVIAQDSGHYVQVDKPSIIVDAIREVMATAAQVTGCA